MNSKSLSKFKNLLRSSGYFSYYLAFGDGNKKRSSWPKFRKRIDDPILGTLLDVFLLEKSVDTALVKKVLGSLIFEELHELQVLESIEVHTRTKDYVLISYHSLCILCQNDLNPEVYFGTDSVALGTYQHPHSRGRTLDLCSGGAIQAMISALHSHESVAVEINNRAAQIAKFNVLLNDLDDKITIHNCSYEEFAKQDHGKFDLITFNPPLLPVPEPLFYPFVGDGGGDGIKLTKEILKLFFPLLTDQGALEFIGCGIGKNGQPYFTKELEAIARKHNASGYTLIPGKGDLIEGKAAFESTVLTTAMASNIPITLARATYELHFKNLEANELYCFFCRFEKTRKDQPYHEGKFRTIDMSDTIFHWFVVLLNENSKNTKLHPKKENILEPA